MARMIFKTAFQSHAIGSLLLRRESWVKEGGEQ